MNKSDRLVQVINKKSRRIIGLMSGMSLDGVDLACVDIKGDFPHIQIELVATDYRVYSADLKSQLIKAQTGSVADISHLNVIVAQEFATCVSEFLKHQSYPVDAIGSHGQTIYHSANAGTSSTLQLGSPSIIAELTGILTVGNFRARDMAAGGRGAPLVGLVDFLLFGNRGLIALNNLGSISNVTVVGETLDQLFAFDTGPANMPIDFFAQKFLTEGIDRGGLLALEGKIIPELLKEFLDHPFFDLVPPKAAGYKEFGPEPLQEISARFLHHTPKDLLRTAVEFSAQTLADAYRKIPEFNKIERAIFSGGGIYNQALMNRIKDLLPEIKIEIMENEFSDAKEAIAFAVLAYLTLSGQPGSYPSLTGVNKPTLLGEIAL